jgi:hypothetical protein
MGGENDLNGVGWGGCGGGDKLGYIFGASVGQVQSEKSRDAGAGIGDIEGFAAQAGISRNRKLGSGIGQNNYPHEGHEYEDYESEG